MIQACIERMAREACGRCAKRAACASLREAFGLRAGAKRPRAAGAGSSRATSPIGAFLREISKAIQATAAPPASALRRKVERLVEPLLPSGDVRMDRVARALGCSRQTLYRRLKAEGITFEQVVDRLRRRLAIRFVREEGVSVKEAAYRLGFAEPAAFSRAFKRWTGSSPSAVRSAAVRRRGNGWPRSPAPAHQPAA